MKKISLWANRHPWTSRIIIIVSFLVLNVLGFTTGWLLLDSGIYLPFMALLSFALIYATGFIFYPFKNKNGKYRMTVSVYIRQKTCGMLLAGSAFFMCIYAGNQREILFRSSFPFSQAVAGNTIIPVKSPVKTYKTIPAFYKSMKDDHGKMLSWKERKKLLKEQVKAIKHTREISNGGKTALIILSILVALGLIGLVAALSCNLSCEGSGAAAVIVGIGGTGLIIFLLFLAIRGILGKKKNKSKPA